MASFKGKTTNNGDLSASKFKKSVQTKRSEEHACSRCDSVWSRWQFEAMYSGLSISCWQPSTS